MKYNFLFWNLQGNQQANKAKRKANICDSLSSLVTSKEIDVFIFCECSIEADLIVSSLNIPGLGSYYRANNKSSRIQFFSRIDRSLVKAAYADQATDRLAIQEFRIGRPPGILLAGLHFYYRGQIPSETGRLNAMIPQAATIRKIERKVGHSRTVLVGDFNMNPYEGAMTAPAGLHSVMSRELAIALPRTKSRRNLDVFFNPTWSSFGDYLNATAGSYYFNTDDEADHRWHLFDQVLLRPELMRDISDLSILIHDGSRPLVTKSGRPRKHALSDHLPIFFALSL